VRVCGLSCLPSPHGGCGAKLIGDAYERATPDERDAWLRQHKACWKPSIKNVEKKS
jgi:hypothetical protein